MKKNKLVLIIIGIVAVLLIAGGLYWALVLNNQQTVKPIDIDKIVLNNLTDNEKLTFDKTKEKLKANPQDVYALIDLATLQKYNGDSEDGIKTLQYAENLDPQNTLILNNMMDLLYNLKRYDEAEQTALKLLESNSQWINAYRMLKDIYQYQKKADYQTNKFPDLVQAGMDKDATGINKQNFTMLLANYYKDVQNKDKALEWWQKYYDLNPTKEVKAELDEVKGWK